MDLTNTTPPFILRYRESTRLFGSSFTAALPYGVLGTLVFLTLVVAGYVMRDDDEQTKTIAAVLIFGALLAYPALMSACLYRIDAHAQGRAVTFAEPLRRAAACFIPCLLGTAGYVLLVSLGCVFLILPGIFLAMHLAFWWTGIVLNEEGIIAAMKSSSRLSWGSWWQVALNFVAVYAVVGANGALERYVDARPGDVWLNGIAGVIGLSMLVVVPMLVCACMVVGYRSLQAQQESA